MSTYQPETHALYRETNEVASQLVQVAVLVATLLAQRAVEAREKRYAMEQAAAEERARVAAEQLRAQRAAAEPVLRSVHQERFWKEPNARRIGRAWQAASEWAAGDPYAAHTLEFLREQLKERFGIEAPAWPVHGAELSRIVTMADPRYRKDLSAARAAAEAVGSASYAVVIRDSRDPYKVLYQGEATAPLGMPAATLAAREFEAWARGEGANSVKGRNPAEFTIEAMENTGAARAAQTPAAEVQGHQVDEVLAADAAWQRAVIEGSEPGTPAETLYAYEQELQRLEEEEKRRRVRRAEYAARLEEEGLSDADRKRLTGNLNSIDEGLTALHQQQADSALHMAAAAAEMRGENPERVFQAARLQESLDEGWWATASAAEVSGVWGHVTKWEPGLARDEMCQVLREEIERHHRLSVPKDASADMVAALFGGREAPGVATPISVRGDALRDQAQAVYESVFDLHAEALTVEQKLSSLGDDGPTSDRGRAAHPDGPSGDVPSINLADSLRARAEAEAQVAGRLIEQATWLDTQTPEVLARLYAENTGAAVDSLSAEFQARWGEALTPAAADLVTEMAQDREAWKVRAGQGSRDPGEVPTVIVGQVVAHGRSADEYLATLADDPYYEDLYIRQREELRGLGLSPEQADERAREGVELQRGCLEAVEKMSGPAERNTGTEDSRDSRVADVPLQVAPEDADLLRDQERRDEERRAEAGRALNDAEDREAAEAVRVTLQAFPESAQAATAVSPGTKAPQSTKGPEAVRQKGPRLER
ncbi:hypothetical protein ABZ383_22690 [Streptomyces sp. NPDC005900]|uniref:hypothetical protein n=1 Tax=Streptomyces sp. NPDC005900 TaxID=3154569 RepID=UPI0033EB3CB7